MDTRALESLIEPVFLQTLERTRGRFVMSELRGECFTAFPELSDTEIEAAVDQLALHYMMKKASERQTLHIRRPWILITSESSSPLKSGRTNARLGRFDKAIGILRRAFRL
jgi:hypothetical protein